MANPGTAELPLVRPFAGLRAVPEKAAEVAAPPYDVLTFDEARQRAKAGRWSFVHVSRPEVDLEPGTDPHGPDAYGKAAENLAAMLDAGVLRRDAQPSYYLYRLGMDGHTQTGVVGAASLPAYEEGRIRRHELTRPDKEDDRVKHMEALGAQTGPVMLTHRRSKTIADIVGRLTETAPDIAITADDGVAHSLWVVAGDDAIPALNAAFESLDALYIADGHHRSAAAFRVAASRRAANPAHHGNEAYNSFLSVSFPEDEVRILDYNRVVRDLGTLTPAAFLERVSGAFTIEESATAVRPAEAGEFGLYLEGRWHRLTLKERPPDEAPALDRLDLTLLSGRLLEPVLGIGDPRSDPRIDFVGGARGLGELERQVDSGEMAAAFAIYPTALQDLMSVADAGEVMPPKSTWFEPKLADGLVSAVLD